MGSMGVKSNRAQIWEKRSSSLLMGLINKSGRNEKSYF